MIHVTGRPGPSYSEPLGRPTEAAFTNPQSSRSDLPMNARRLHFELVRRAARLAENIPPWALERAAQEIVAAFAASRFGSAIHGELGELHPAELWDMGDETAALALDSLRWPQYRDRALARWRQLSLRSRRALTPRSKQLKYRGNAPARSSVDRWRKDDRSSNSR